MKIPPASNPQPRGFALVVTVSLMILLAVICVGLLGLSAISLRSSTQAQAQAEAQANARLALMIAIGELQKQLGPDQRVSANGSILSESAVSNPHWTGVWDSWKAGPTSAADDNPSAPSDHRTIPPARDVRNGMHPTYLPNRRDHFRGWLVSIPPEAARDIDSARNLSLDGLPMPAGNATAVRLVGEGTLGTGSQGGDSAGFVNAGLENVVETERLSTLPSLLTVGLVEGATELAARNFHSVTAHSHKVLADVREGGLQRDLSTLLERPINLNEAGDEFMLYRFSTTPPGDTRQERVPIHDLAAFYQLYDQTRYAGTGESWRRGVSYNSNRLPNAVQVAQPELGDRGSQERFLRQYSRMYTSPVPVKIQILVTMTAEPIRPQDLVRGGDTHYVRFHKQQNDQFQPHQQAAPGWNPNVLFPMSNTIWGPTNDENVYSPGSGRFLPIKATDQIAIRITTDQDDGTDYAHDSEWPGAAFSFMTIQNNHQSRQTNLWGFRNYPALSRRYSSSTGQGSYGVRTNTRFNDGLLKKGFPSDPRTLNRSAQELIGMSQRGQHWPLFQFALMAGSETSEATNSGSFGGRKFASRPFLHSSPLSPPHIDRDDFESFYNYGLSWWIEEVNSILEANIQIDRDNRRGYYGGGYTPEYVDVANEPHIRPGPDLTAPNQTYGRKMEIISFRWLNSSEV